MVLIFLFCFYISAEEKGGEPTGFGEYFALIFSNLHIIVHIWFMPIKKFEPENPEKTF